MASFDRKQPLFEKDMDLLIQSPDKEDRKSTCTIRILRGVNNSPTLRIEVTEDIKDPFFVQVLHVNEETFHELKQDQTLLVDFETFPMHLMELLQCCDTSHTNITNNMSPTRPSSQAPQSYALILKFTLNSQTSTLSIVEMNRFKYLTHLSLKLTTGDDGMVKQYLASRLGQTLEEVDVLTNKLSEMTLELRRASAAEAQMKEEVTALTQRREQDLSKSEIAQERLLTEEREKQLEMKQQLEVSSQNQVNALRAKLEKEISQLTLRLEESEGTRHEITEEKNDVASELREAKKRLERGKERQVAMENELDKTRKKMDEMEANVFEQNRAQNQAELRVAVLEQSLTDKQEVLDKTMSLLKLAENHKAELDDSVQLYKKNHASVQQKLEQSIAEIQKGNHIIEKMHSENRSLKSKMRVKSKIIVQQESLVLNKQTKIEDLLRKLNQLNADYSDAKSSQEILKVNLEGANKKLQESNKLLSSNQQVISWLNKEINNTQLSQGPVSSVYQSSSTNTTTVPSYDNTTTAPSFVS